MRYVLTLVFTLFTTVASASSKVGAQDDSKAPGNSNYCVSMGNYAFMLTYTILYTTNDVQDFFQRNLKQAIVEMHTEPKSSVFSSTEEANARITALHNFVLNEPAKLNPKDVGEHVLLECKKDENPEHWKPLSPNASGPQEQSLL
jgi:hypothetical protein